MSTLLDQAPARTARRRGLPQAADGSAAAEGRVSILVPAFVFSMILPNYFFLGPVRLSPFLILLLVSFIPLVIQWVASGRATLPDVMILGSALWSGMAEFYHSGSEAIERVAIVLLQTFGAYLIGRMLVRGPEAMWVVVRTFFICMCIVVPFAIYEAVTAEALYFELFRMIGPAFIQVWAGDPRLGFDRAQGAFEHPILWGIFASSLIAVTWGMVRKLVRRLMMTGLLVLGVFTSLSTGALLSMNIQLGLLAWGQAMRHHPRPWKLLLILIAIAYVFIDVLSNRSPFHVFVDYFTLNSGTAYFRILTWHYGTAEIMRNPVLGVGMFGDWERPIWMSASSFDMFWLVPALRYGIPATALLGGGFLILMIRAGNRSGPTPEIDRIRIGLLLALAGIYTSAWSVHLWNAVFCWMMFLSGCLGWLAETGTPNAVLRARAAKRRSSGIGGGRAGAEANSETGPETSGEADLGTGTGTGGDPEHKPRTWL